MIVYLDMDGVLTQCHMGALQYYGMNPNEYPRGMRVKDILNGAGVTTKASYDDFWADFGEDFWDSLTPTDECLPLIQMCAELVGNDSVFIASRPTSNPQSLSGKMYWILENLPPWIHSQVVFLQQKELLSFPGTILVDDSRENCKKFDPSKGKSILVKRPWNDNDDMPFHELVAALKEAVG